MITVKQIIPLSGVVANSGLTLGGSKAEVGAWPVNPDGEPLVLVATIDFSKIQGLECVENVPGEGTLHIFTTYSKSDYFLENVTYGGDPSELEAILRGYTLVVRGQGGVFQESPVDSIPEAATELKDRDINEDDFPVFSMVSNVVPHGVNLPDEFVAEYDFLCQFYSSDFSDPFKDVFYLTDAVGYLFLKKDRSGSGVFFVQAA